MSKPRILLFVLLLALVPATATSGPRGDSQLRTVRGTVVDKQDNPVSAGVVYLKNLHTQSVKTYISDDSGHYRFSGLDPNVDYELHAEYKDLTSARHTISSFDSRKEIIITLKVDKKKSEK